MAKMLLFFAILFVVAISVLIGFFVRREVVKTLSEHNVRELPPTDYRPLFQPDEAELRDVERMENALLAETKRQNDLNEVRKKLAKFDELRQTWAQKPTRGNTIELLVQASAIADGRVYLETCEHVLSLWRAEQVADLSADDLAQLLDSHFWLLPDGERTPGVSFRLKEEIAGLRRES